ncbi:CRP-like cAMP-binding protein [Mesorhizobium sp. YL-MeA3-2017]|jgi:CRP-like cAMP-binding protein|uniref:Crp/Fnr family transcriptional regulator n=1 Tax=Mesorhizobium sp. YL-MeA3-2017 TaxID=3042284 RepID=UPI0015C9427F|nr:Crp/Fnr family transcriptional regulator [Mesorhizobium sp. YL-MeA3-2017]MDQ0333480.1 CRP-like cAMP-binding protein [Mesorhizobium sp. YL-MeA3-2017]
MTAPYHLTRRNLAGLDLFRGLSAAALDEVLAKTRCRLLGRDCRVFNQGDGRIRAHALLEGSVRISQSGSDGGQIVVRFIAAGEMFGTMALFTDRRYPADAETLTEVVEVSWSEPDLLKVMTRYPQIAINALKIVGRRIQEAQYRVRELSTQPVDRRVAHTLLRLAKQAGRRAQDGVTIPFPLRRKDIADICGTTLYSVSRVLTAWERQGFLVSQDQRLTITKLSAIERIADDEHT